MIRTLVATVAVTDLRIATLNGEAMFFSESLDFSQYKAVGATTGYYLKFVDSGGKAAFAYGYTQGVGEALGADVLNPLNFTSVWTASDATINDANTFTTSAINGRVQHNSLTEIGRIYKSSMGISVSAGTSDIYMIGPPNLYFAANTTTGYANKYGTALTAIFIINNDVAGAVVDINSASLTPLTSVPSTGLNLVSARDGSTRNMESVETGFLPNSITTVYIYQISAQPPLATVAVTNLRIASKDGEAMFFSESLDFSAYAGGTKLIAFKDSGNRFAYGYGGAVGGGEALGADLVTNGNMETGSPPTGYSSTEASMASVADERTGGSGTKSISIAYISIIGRVYPTFTAPGVGSIVKLSCWGKFVAGSGGVIYGGGSTLTYTSSWSNKTGYSTGAAGWFLQLRANTGSTDIRYDDLCLFPLTNVPATGLLLVSAYGGATRNMLSTETNFSPNTITTVYVYDVVAPSTPSPADGATVAYTTSQALQVTNADSGACDIKFYTGAGVQIGATQSAVAAGATAIVTWTGLDPGVKSWYATATNVVGTISSPVWSFTINAKPTVDNLSPANGSTVPSATTIPLSADYHDASVGGLRFYDESDDSLIGTASGLSDGDTGTVNWSGRTPGQALAYYVVPTDGTDDGAASADTTFTINETPNAPTNPDPADGAVLPSATSVALSIDVTDDNDADVDVSFYDASDDSLIGTDSAVPSGGTATVPWDGLTPGQSYVWYVVVTDDSGDTTTSVDYDFRVMPDDVMPGKSLLVAPFLSRKVGRSISNLIKNL